MTFQRVTRTAAALSLAVLLAACGGNPFSRNPSGNVPDEFNPRVDDEGRERDTIWDLFSDADNPNVTLEVNRYLWNASLDVLNFLPIQRIDPFSGVIVTGYGTPPGGGRAYRATVYVTDPALDARSLKVALATRSGPADPDTVRAVEDAILTRARQIRIAHSQL
ncbi:DUF3576 domain-containing protein [Tropicimonas isoalkanivorans]|uniref:DUF3576 domain-containing protein n=1 Tax=Tropicimonas isoalkanivorans TaxID=441112 RepID=A0A1I1KV61_9RHOB|nr:DUF3576 domain-containing protein [Tropicimonas isoalkanivorans]SFC64495.1 protein of unknown function [Tropicimonas isoalkanivorans]